MGKSLKGRETGHLQLVLMKLIAAKEMTDGVL
jgi:hypothetical protein